MKIFVKNLDEKVSSKDLRKAAEAFGKVLSVSLINDVKTQKPMGTAYIEMSSKQETLDAIKGLKGLELKGKKITVKEAVSESVKQDSKQKSGFQSGGNFFSGAKGGFKKNPFTGTRGSNRGK